MTTAARLDAWYRRSGANLPGGDPRPSHGATMEGWFWRFTDRRNARVVVVLCGVNRHPDGDWATVAVAAHPGGFVSSAVLHDASASTTDFDVRAGDGAFRATAHRLHVDLGDACVDIEIADPVWWPLRLGGGGVLSAVPFLGQYWHPHLLGGAGRGEVRVGSDRWCLERADVYAEKNWGERFPDRWWWGQAQAFDRDDVCVAFAGGVLRAGPVAATVGGAVVRIGATVVRLAMPLSIVRTQTDGSVWRVEARGGGHRVRVAGDAVGPPHVLPVPVGPQRRNVDTDLQHLAGRLVLEVEGRTTFRGESELAGLEIGWLPANELDAGTRA